MNRWRCSVVGVGTAGRARAKAIHADPRCELIGVWRGRHAAEIDAPEFASLEEAFAADVVAIASPTAVHAEQVHAALVAGRHVVVEFPITDDPAVAAELWRRAGPHQVLHEEHIELLGGAAAALRAGVRDPRHLEMAFTGPGAPPDDRASLAKTQHARIHRLVDVGGPIAAIAEMVDLADGLHVRFDMVSGATATLTVRKGPGLPRQTRLNVDSGTGVWAMVDRAVQHDGIAVPIIEPESLFSADHDILLAKLEHRAESSPSIATNLHVLDVAHRVACRQIGKVPDRDVWRIG